MSRSVDVRNGHRQAFGFDMVAGAHKTTSHPSLASGCSPVALADSGSGAGAPSGVAGSPGAVLGTGSNTDTYTPGIEAV